MKEKDYSWEAYMFLGYRVTEDEEDEKQFNAFIKKLLRVQAEEILKSVLNTLNTTKEHLNSHWKDCAPIDILEDVEEEIKDNLNKFIEE